MRIHELFLRESDEERQRKLKVARDHIIAQYTKKPPSPEGQARAAELKRRSEERKKRIAQGLDAHNPAWDKPNNYDVDAHIPEIPKRR
jgi:hypothetical protein